MESLVSIIALAVAIAALGLTALSLLVQRRHNILSVKPIAHIGQSDYENTIEVTLVNKGVGPLLIKRLVAISSDGKSCSTLINLMPKTPQGLAWDTFYYEVDGGVLQPGEVITLLRISNNNGLAMHPNFKESLRKNLSNISITVEWTDVYGSTFKAGQFPLTVFGRSRAGKVRSVIVE